MLVLYLLEEFEWLTVVANIMGVLSLRGKISASKALVVDYPEKNYNSALKLCPVSLTLWREWRGAGIVPCQCKKRYYGVAPTRVRPVETVREHAWRQSERETSASLLIVFMFVVPLWMIILSQSNKHSEKGFGN